MCIVKIIDFFKNVNYKEVICQSSFQFSIREESNDKIIFKSPDSSKREGQNEENKEFNNLQIFNEKINR